MNYRARAIRRRYTRRHELDWLYLDEPASLHWEYADV